MSQRRSPAGSAAASAAAAALVFAALGDATRLRIVSELSASGPLSITRLSADAPVTRQAISKHLRALADAGLVKDSRRGRERLWQLEPQRLEVARRQLDRISAQWDVALERLRRLVDGDGDA